MPRLCLVPSRCPSLDNQPGEARTTDCRPFVPSSVCGETLPPSANRVKGLATGNCSGARSYLIGNKGKRFLISVVMGARKARVVGPSKGGL